jgi:hypothetical protein
LSPSEYRRNPRAAQSPCTIRAGQLTERVCDTIPVKEIGMPIRDHFRPPVSEKASWEGFDGMWPASIVRNEEPPIYAAFCRWVTKGTRARLEAWSHSLAVGQPLPTLPHWLREDLVIALDLEESYERTCRDL